MIINGSNFGFDQPDLALGLSVIGGFYLGSSSMTRTCINDYTNFNMFSPTKQMRTSWSYFKELCSNSKLAPFTRKYYNSKPFFSLGIWMVLFLIYNQCLVCFLTYIHKWSVSACVIEVFVMLRMLGFCMGNTVTALVVMC